MILQQIQNSFIFYNEDYLYYIKDYYDYLVNLIKERLYLHPEMEKNIIVGDYHYVFYNNYNPVIRIQMNFEHTLVVPGGRDSQNAPTGSILVPDSDETYLIRIDNYNSLNRFDIIIDYSFPNCVNIASAGPLFSQYLKKTICISPLLYPIYFEKENRTISCLTTFINTQEPRRQKLLASMPSTIGHVNVNTCFNRDDIIALYKNTKILINIHQTDHHHTCEELRILPALMCGVIVVSEESPLSEKIPYHEHIVWVKYENIIECVENIQKNYDHFHSEILSPKLVEIFERIDVNNKISLETQLLKVKSNYYDVSYGQFCPNGLKTTHNAGFFSCCSVLLHLIVHFFNVYKKIPDFVDTEKTFEWYKPEGQERDIYSDYFRVDSDLKIEYQGHVDYIEDYQFRNFRDIQFDKIVPFIRKFFGLSSDILSIVDELERKYNIDYENTCVLFLRGNDKSTECTIPDYSFYKEQIRGIQEKEPNIRVLIQSDETEFIEEMCRDISGAFCFKDEIRHIKKSNTTVDVVYKYLNYEFSKKFLAITWIMSKCKYVVCNYGNCSIWITFFRGHMNNVIEYYQPR
jgi:hypothetical protein